MSDVIAKLRNELTSIKLAEKRLILIEHQLEDTLHDLNNLHKLIDKEYQDVERLEKLSSGVLFKKFLGDRVKNLDKEKEEYLHAVLKYDGMANKAKILQFEKEILINKISKKQALYEELENHINQSAKISSKIDKNPLYNAIQNLDKQIQKLQQIKIEIDEAIKAALNLKNYLILARKNLSSFDNVSADGFQFLFYEQINYLKNIRQVFAMIDHLENQLNKELKDIDTNLQSRNSYTPYINFFETMFKTTVRGWVTNTHLKRSKDCINKNILNTDDIIKYLQNQLAHTNTEITSIQQEKILYLDNI